VSRSIGYGAIALGVLLLPAVAALAPFDMGGHWAGLILATDTFTVSADLVVTGSRSFTGSAQVGGGGTVDCQVHGKRRRKVVIRARCTDGTRATLVGNLDVASGTVAGTARLSKRHRHARGTFTLSQEAALATTTTTVGTVETTTTVIIVPPQVREVTEVEPDGDATVATDVGSPDVLVHGAIQPSGDLDFFAFTVSAPSSDVTFETFDGSGPGHCAGIDTYLEIRGTDGNSIIGTDDDDGVGACSKLTLQGLPPGTYFACVRGFGLSTTIPVYELLITVP
jgi:hypothetical protein